MFRGLKALFAGLLAGVGLGVLFSPKKGKDIRKDIKDEVDDGGTGLGTVKDTIVDMGKEIGGTCKECYEEVTESEEYQEGKEKLKNIAHKKYKKHVPAGTRKKIKKGVTKAHKTAKKVVSEAKKKFKK